MYTFYVSYVTMTTMLIDHFHIESLINISSQDKHMSAFLQVCAGFRSVEYSDLLKMRTMQKRKSFFLVVTLCTKGSRTVKGAKTSSSGRVH